MAEFKFAKGSPEWLMFQDYYKICQKYWLPEETDEYWRGIVKEMGEFSQKYNNIKLSEKLYIALIEAQEDIMKK